MKLTVLSRGDKEIIQLSEKTSTLGRGSNVDFQIRHPKISRTHLSLKVIKRELHIQDLNSRNGFKVDGHRVKNSIIESGGQFTIDDIIFIFTYKPEDSKQKNPSKRSYKNILNPAWFQIITLFFHKKPQRIFVMLMIFSLTIFTFLNLESMLEKINPSLQNDYTFDPSEITSKRSAQDIQRFVGKIRKSLKNIEKINTSQDFQDKRKIYDSCLDIVAGCQRFKISPPELSVAQNIINDLNPLFDEKRLEFLKSSESHYQKFQKNYDIRDLQTALKIIEDYLSISNAENIYWNQMNQLKTELLKVNSQIKP